MAAALYLVSKSASNKAQTVNDIHAVLIAGTDADTDAEVIAAAIGQANAMTWDGNGPALAPIGDDGYFDTVLDITDLAAGPLKDAGDAFIFTPAGPVKVEG